MWHYIHDIQRTFLDFTHQMNTMEWGVFLLVVVGIGVICMRGFGSWKAY
jgi:hypothetical protein